MRILALRHLAGRTERHPARAQVEVGARRARREQRRPCLGTLARRSVTTRAVLEVERGTLLPDSAAVLGRVRGERLLGERAVCDHQEHRDPEDRGVSAECSNASSLARVGGVPRRCHQSSPRPAAGRGRCGHALPMVPGGASGAA